MKDNDNETVVKEYTREELAITENEHHRNMGRMAYDVMDMMSTGLHQDAAMLIGTLRYNQNTPYRVVPLLINGINTVCVLLHINSEQTAVFPILNSGFTITDVNGEVIPRFDEAAPKKPKYDA